jgi:hypothetical protein
VSHDRVGHSSAQPGLGVSLIISESGWASVDQTPIPMDSIHGSPSRPWCHFQTPKNPAFYMAQRPNGTDEPFAAPATDPN